MNRIPPRLLLLAAALSLAAPTRLPAQNFNGLTLFGITFGRDELVTIDRASGQGTVIGSLGETSASYGIAARNDRIYAFDQVSNRIREINKINGRFTRDIDIGLSGLQGEGDIAFRPSDGVGFLASALNSDSEPTNDFYTFTITDNTDVGVAVRLGSTGVAIDALAFDSNNTLYAIGQGDGTLYTINQATGAATAVGSLGVTVNSPIAGMAFAPADSSESANGDLYAALNDRLYRINTSTGAATPVSTAVVNFGPLVSSVSGLTFAPGEGTLGNMSARLNVGTAEKVGIVGFIIRGTPNKRVVLRGIGPSLKSRVSGSLADPVLELFNGQGVSIAQNDDFSSSPDKREITDLGLAPGDPKESAILRTLPSGNYTAILSGASGTGIGLVEVYDVDDGNGSRLANLSARGFVESGNNALIGGLIVSGSASQRIVVRAIGPDLANSGVPNVLADPTLQIYDSNGALLKSNDNFTMDPDAAEIASNGLAPGNNRDAATIVTLAPGAYTAIVRGAGNNDTGVALVESFNLTSNDQSSTPTGVVSGQ